MELAFENPELREICENKTQSEIELGVGPASELQQCLADLVAADSLVDLPEQPETTREGTLQIITNSGTEVILSVNHSNLAGPLDRSRVRRIKILKITNR